MSGNKQTYFFRVRVRVQVRVPIVLRSFAFPIGSRTGTRSCHVTQKLYFLNHAKNFKALKKKVSALRCNKANTSP